MSQIALNVGTGHHADHVYQDIIYLKVISASRLALLGIMPLMVNVKVRKKFFPGIRFLACPTNCANCTSASVCISCQNGYLMSEQSCVTTCPAKTYNVLGVCTGCSDHCTTCVDEAKCIACETGWNLLNYICTSQCPTGFYKENGACQGCPIGCTNCDDAKNCGACNNGYVFYEKTCPFKCPDGTYNVNGFCEGNGDLFTAREFF